MEEILSIFYDLIINSQNILILNINIYIFIISLIYEYCIIPIFLMNNYNIFINKVF